MRRGPADQFRCQCIIQSETAICDRDRHGERGLICNMRGTSIRDGRWVCRYHIEAVNPLYTHPNMFLEFEANFQNQPQPGLSQNQS